MKRLAILMCVVLFAGCGAFQIEDTPTHQAIAYAAGKTMGIAITKLEPDLNEPLGEKFDAMMATVVEGSNVVSPENILRFYSDSLSIIALHTGDEYGLIQDLSVLLLIFGAEYDADGELVSIQPIPVLVLTFFATGYDSGVMITERELKME